MNRRAHPPSWRELHPADDPRAEARQAGGFGATSRSENLARTGQLILALRQLTAAVIRARQPDLSDAALRAQLAERWLGHDRPAAH